MEAVTSEDRTRDFSGVLVPIDGSPCGDRALRVGFSLAQRAGLPVTIVHAADSADARPPAEVREHLARVEERFAAVADCTTTTVSGRPADVILDAARERNALICMASHGRRGLARLVLGSVAEEVVRRCRDGLVIVGPRCTSFALAGEPAMILFCTDGSPEAVRAAPATAQLIRQLDADLLIVEQVPPDEDVTDDDSPPPRPNLDAARTHCQALRGFFQDRGIVSTSKVLFGDPVRSIADEAASLSASIVSLGTHGRAGLDRFAAGSIAVGLVRRSPCPVFVVGPAAVGPIGPDLPG